MGIKFVEADGPGPKRDLVGYGRYVPKVTWPNGARIAVSVVLNWEEGSEVGKNVVGDGRSESALTEIPYVMDAQYRDLAAESVYEYGSRAGVWRIQRLVDSYKIPITFFGAAVSWERNPEVAAWVRRVPSRAVLARLALGGAVAAERARRSRSTWPRRSPRSSAPAANGPAAGTAVTARRSTRESSWSRTAGSPTTPTSTTTNCPTTSTSRAPGTSSCPTAHLQRREVRAAPGYWIPRRSSTRSSAGSTTSGTRAPRTRA